MPPSTAVQATVVLTIPGSRGIHQWMQRSTPSSSIARASPEVLRSTNSHRRGSLLPGPGERVGGRRRRRPVGGPSSSVAPPTGPRWQVDTGPARGYLLCGKAYYLSTPSTLPLLPARPSSWAGPRLSLASAQDKGNALFLFLFFSSEFLKSIVHSFHAQI